MIRTRRWPPATACLRRLRPLLGLALAGALVLTACSLVQQDLPNEPPVVQVRDVDTTRVKRGGSVALRVTASDDDDDPLTYLWLSDAGSFTQAGENATDWIAPNQILGASEFFLITVIVQDRRRETEDPVETFVIEVVQRPPTLLSVPADQQATTADTIVLAALGDDPDGDQLTYLWTVRGGAASDATTTREVRLADDGGAPVAVLRGLGQGSHHADGQGTVWIRQQRASGGDDSVRVQVLPQAAARYTVQLAVTDAIEAASDTVTASFDIQVQAAPDTVATDTTTTGTTSDDG